MVLLTWGFERLFFFSSSAQVAFCKLYLEAKFQITCIGSDARYKVCLKARACVRACVCPLYSVLQCQNMKGLQKTTLDPETCFNITFNVCYYRYAAGVLLIVRYFNLVAVFLTCFILFVQH